MSELDPGIAEVLCFVNEAKIRATYGAVAAVVGGSAQSIGGRLGARRPEASWVVNTSTGFPTDYKQHQIHPDLFANSIVVRDGSELRRRIETWKRGH